MEQSNSNRFINILIIIAGLFCCIAAGFIPAPEGILGDGRLTLIESHQMAQLIPFFILPSLLMVIAGILVILGRFNALALIASIGGTILYAVLDAGLAFGHQAYSGVLMNMFGAIMMLTGTALQTFATDNGPAVVSRKAALKRSNKNPKEFRYERKNAPKYDDIYVDAATTAAVAHALDLAELELEDNVTTASDEAVGSDPTAEPPGALNAEEEIASLRAAIGLDNDSDSDNEAFVPVHSMSADELIAMLMEEETASANSDIEDILLMETSTNEDLTADDVMSASSDLKVATEEDSDNQIHNSIDQNIPTSVDAAHKAMADALETPNKTMTDFYSGIEEIFLDYDGRL